MRVGRVLPPAAAPVAWRDLCGGVAGLAAQDGAVEWLERDLREHFGARGVFLLSSGTAALAVTLMALRASSSRTEVVIPAYTCFSVPAAVVRAGLRPVPCDIAADRFDYDLDALERTLTERTLCVVVQHLFGVPAAVAEIRALCQPRGIVVVEDAAQAMGGTAPDGRALGTIGDAGIFSFGRGKNITCGGGGAVVTCSVRLTAAIARRVRLLPRPNMLDTLRQTAVFAALALMVRPWLYWIPAAIPSLHLGETIFPRHIALLQMSGAQAGALRRWRARLSASNRRRAAVAADLNHRLAAGALPPAPLLRFPIFIEDAGERERLLQLSRQRGLGISPAYPSAVDGSAELRDVLGTGRFPTARRVAETILTLPTHHFVSERDRQTIAACVASARQPIGATAPAA